MDNNFNNVNMDPVLNSNPNSNLNMNENTNMNQNMNTNPNPNQTTDNIDNIEGDHVNLNKAQNQGESGSYTPNSNLDIKGVNFNKQIPSAKKGGSGLAALALIISILSAALAGFLVYQFLNQNKKLDKLNAQIYGMTTSVNNKVLEMDKKIRNLDDLKKELEKGKKTEDQNKVKENNKSSYKDVAENVLNEIGRDYKKEPKDFQDDKGKLNQKSFENKFLNNKEISKMKTDGAWKTETSGATIRFTYTFKEEKDKENNFYLDLTLQSNGGYEVKAIKGNVENESNEESNKVNFDNNGANNE